jgi:hypothetical protein
MLRIFFCVSLVMLASCAKPQPKASFALLEADDAGKVIRKITEGEYPPTIRFETLEYRKIGDAIHVPVRVTCLHTGGVYTFDSNELTDQYTEYLNNSAQLAGARIAYQRQKELLEARVSSEKEFLEARIKYQEYARIVNKIENNFRIMGIPLPVIKNLRSGWVLLTGDVPENELNTVHKGMKIRVELHAYTGKVIEATIAGISEQINPTSRTAKIFMALANHKGHYSPGMFGTGLIERTGKQTLAAPSTAIVQIGAKNYLFRQKDSVSIERVEVETGAEDGAFIAVLSGVKEGDKIVTRGASLLKGLSFGY